MARHRIALGASPAAREREREHVYIPAALVFIVKHGALCRTRLPGNVKHSKRQQASLVLPAVYPSSLRLSSSCTVCPFPRRSRLSDISRRDLETKLIFARDGLQPLRREFAISFFEDPINRISKRRSYAGLTRYALPTPTTDWNTTEVNRERGSGTRHDATLPTPPDLPPPDLPPPPRSERAACCLAPLRATSSLLGRAADRPVGRSLSVFILERRETNTSESLYYKYIRNCSEIKFQRVTR